MKITKIYIENFGKLSQQQYYLQDNITQLLEQNGFGKTTFASFLKAMFYGMPSVRQNAKEFNDREHYAPFHGGKFGGNIHFIYENKNYSIERFFDRKSERKDSIKVYCNGREYTGFQAEIGKELFDLDKESFEKTVFITADILESTTTADIQAKLGHFMDNTTTTYNFSTAIAQLENAKREYKYNKGKGGKIYNLECRQKICYSELDRLNTLSDSLERYYLEYNALKVELEQTRESIEFVSKTPFYLERYAEYQTKIQYLEEKIEALQTEYKNGLPTSAEFATLRTSANRLLQLEMARTQKNFPPEKLEKLINLQKLFADNLIFSEDTPLQQLNGKDTSFTHIAKPSIQSTTDFLEKKLQEIKDLIAKWTEKQTELVVYNNAVNNTVTFQDNLSTSSSVSSHNQLSYFAKNKSNIIAITRILLFMIGITFIITASFISKNIGVVLFIIGIFLFLSAILWTTFSNRQKTNTASKDSYTQTLMPLSTQSTNGTQLQKRIEDSTTKIAELEREYATYTLQLQDFFNCFGYTDNNFLQNFTNLHFSFKEYQTLQHEYENFVVAIQQIDNEIIDIKEKIQTLLHRYSIVMQADFAKQVEVLQNQSKDLENLILQKDREQTAAQEYYSKHNLANIQLQNSTARIDYGLSDKDEPTTKNIDIAKKYAINLEEKQKKFASLENSIAEIEQQLLLYSSYENELADIQNQLKVCQEEYTLLTMTIDYLQQAEDNIKNRYLRPLQNKLENYNLKEILGIDMHLDSNLNLTYESAGERHTSNYLSTGQRTLCLFVLRLALIDSLFQKEKPLLILDDPFVNLDEKHIKACHNILSHLAKDRQILYFCCHASRKIL